MPAPVQACTKLKPAPLISVQGWLQWNGSIEPYYDEIMAG